MAAVQFVAFALLSVVLLATRASARSLSHDDCKLGEVTCQNCHSQRLCTTLGAVVIQCSTLGLQHCAEGRCGSQRSAKCLLEGFAARNTLEGGFSSTTEGPWGFTPESRRTTRTTRRPTATTSKPTGTTSNPSGTTSNPSGTTSNPSGTTNNPSSTTRTTTTTTRNPWTTTTTNWTTTTERSFSFGRIQLEA